MMIELAKAFDVIKKTQPPTINIVDVGVLRGSFYEDAQKYIGNLPAFWIGVEPDICFPHITKVYNTIYNVAVDDVDVPEKRTFHINSDRGISSLLELNKEYWTNNPEEEGKYYIPSHVVADTIIEEKEVDVVSMKYILDSISKFSKEHIHFLKIDAQGVDINVVKSMKGYLDKTLFIMIESITNTDKNAVLYKNQSNIEEDILVMESLGFEMFSMKDYGKCIGPQSGMPCSPEADVVFINKSFINTDRKI
jgi:hypothetical protein